MGLKQGLEQGLQQGLEQGEWQAKTKMVLNAHQMGLPIQIIGTLAGLSEAEVLSILQRD